MDTNDHVQRCFEAFAHKLESYLGVRPYSRAIMHSALASILGVYRERFKLNNLEITFALAMLLECDEEVAGKFVKLLMEFKRRKNETRRNELLRELRVSRALEV